MCVCALYILKMYLLYYIYYGCDLRLCMYTYMFLCSLSIQAMNLSVCIYIYVCVRELCYDSIKKISFNGYPIVDNR